MSSPTSSGSATASASSTAAGSSSRVRSIELLDRFALPVYRVEVEPGQTEALDRLAARLQPLPWVTATSIDHGLLTIAVADPTVAARELLPIVGAAGLAIIAVARARPTLEDVFLRLTGGGSAAA